MDWRDPYTAIDRIEEATALETELRREVNPGHVLHGVAVEAIARRCDQDYVVFRFLDGSDRIAEVHLTWAKGEQPPWPHTVIFDSIDDWANATRDEFHDEPD